MRVLSAAELLVLWEYGVAQSLPQWALSLLVAVNPEFTPESLAKQRVGWRDSCLLTLRERLFGTRIDGLAVCPNCGEKLELTLDTADLRVVPQTESTEKLCLNQAGYEINFRLPNSVDLIAASTQEDTTAGRPLLLQRCLVSTVHEGKEIGFDQISSNVVDAIIEQMAEGDPQADVQLALSCPACQHQWQILFDIVSYLWEEINTWARLILQEVHLLASAYGWREADILALSSHRRHLYLEMISG